MSVPPKLTPPALDEELGSYLRQLCAEVNAVVAWINERTRPPACLDDCPARQGLMCDCGAEGVTRKTAGGQR